MALVLPFIRQQFFDLNGDPLAGGKIFTYAAGSSTPKATYTDQGGLTQNTNPIILDAAGAAPIWIGSSYYKFVITDADDVVIDTIDAVTAASSGGGGGGALPVGGLAGDALIKQSGIDGDADWDGMAFSGVSALTGAQWDSYGVKEALTKIIRITYTPPQMNFSASGAGTLRERGNAVTSSTLQAITTKKSDPIAAVRFYQGATLLNTVSSPNPAGGTNTYSWTGSFSTNTTFSAQVDDNGATGGPTTVTGSQTFQFVYPYYYGAGASGKTAAQVGAMLKQIINSTATLVETFSAAGGDVFYFAYPASYGALTSILDVNNFETISDWTTSSQNITGLDGNPVSYRIYEFNNPVLAGSYQYTFKR